MSNDARFVIVALLDGIKNQDTSVMLLDGNTPTEGRSDRSPMKQNREYDTSTSGTRAKTKEEMRDEFLAHVRSIALEWSQYNTATELERCNGVAFSILSLLDGSSVGFPATNISLSTHPDDKAFYIENGENWLDDEMVINDDVMLHEMYYE